MSCGGNECASDKADTYCKNKADIDGNASGETYENKLMFSGISVIIGGKKLMVGGKCR